MCVKEEQCAMITMTSNGKKIIKKKISNFLWQNLAFDTFVAPLSVISRNVLKCVLRHEIF
jgi:hypothetical protein